jgi:hypothetical protein
MAEDLLTDDEQWEAIKRWTTENGTDGWWAASRLARHCCSATASMRVTA